MKLEQINIVSEERSRKDLNIAMGLEK